MRLDRFWRIIFIIGFVVSSPVWANPKIAGTYEGFHKPLKGEDQPCEITFTELGTPPLLYLVESNFEGRMLSVYIEAETLGRRVAAESDGEWSLHRVSPPGSSLGSKLIKVHFKSGAIDSVYLQEQIIRWNSLVFCERLRKK